MLESPWVRFAISGTLITAHLVGSRLAKRGRPSEPKPPAPAWVRPLIAVSVTGYYLLIGPTGGPLWGGLGNLAGIALALVAIAYHPHVRYPELASRCLFYVALPIAVGVPYGLLALSLPACASSVYCCHLADRAQVAGGPRSASLLRYRLVPGVW